VNRPAWGQSAGAVLFFLAATILFTWPVAGHLSGGLADPWDAKLNAWILHWDFHQTFHDPRHLFDANIFYPARYALAFSENLYGASLFGFPLYAMGLSTLTVYNALFLLGMFLSALAAWALAREWTGDARASLLAGVVYAFLAFVWIQGRNNPRFGMALHQSTVIMMAVWYVLCWTGLLGPVANWAHTAGILVGVAWGFLDRGAGRRIHASY